MKERKVYINNTIWKKRSELAQLDGAQMMGRSHHPKLVQTGLGQFQVNIWIWEWVMIAAQNNISGSFTAADPKYSSCCFSSTCSLDALLGV